jgi:hypothetical protein
MIITDIGWSKPKIGREGSGSYDGESIPTGGKNANGAPSNHPLCQGPCVRSEDKTEGRKH